jgi:hypothetical protein
VPGVETVGWHLCEVLAVVGADLIDKADVPFAPGCVVDDCAMIDVAAQVSR